MDYEQAFNIALCGIFLSYASMVRVQLYRNKMSDKEISVHRGVSECILGILLLIFLFAGPSRSTELDTKPTSEQVKHGTNNNNSN